MKKYFLVVLCLAYLHNLQAQSTLTWSVVSDNNLIYSAGGNTSTSGSTIPVSGPGRRMMWYADKAAFRAGYVDATQWNSENIGLYSVALGKNSKANGENAMALGWGTIAGTNSTALGYNTLATGNNSTALGNSTTAEGDWSFAAGFNTKASGNYSTALGTAVTTNKQLGSFIIGDALGGNTAFGNDANNQMMMRFLNGYKFFAGSLRLAVSINQEGTVGIDQSNQNNGTVNSGLIFGLQSGEGIASKRTAGGNQWGLDFYTNYINRISITNLGKVGIGTTTPQQQLSVVGGMNIDQNNLNSGSYLQSALTFGSGSGEGIASNRAGGVNQYGLDLYAGGINRVSITNAGNIGIGIAQPGAKLHVVGNILASGTITPSDVRYKKDIQPLNGALKTIMSLSAFSYLLRTKEFPEMQFDSRRQLGFIAQDVETVLPELVYTVNNGYKAIDYTRIVPLLVEGMKEQQHTIEKQQHTIDQQQQQIDELKKIVTEFIKNK